MTIKLKNPYPCDKCGAPLSAHRDDGSADWRCPVKGGFSKKRESTYWNSANVPWRIEQCKRWDEIRAFSRFVSTPMEIPTIKWKIGDRVSYGNWDDLEVVEVYDEGRRLIVRNKSGDYEGRWWFDVQPYDPKRNNGFEFAQRREPIDFHTSWLYGLIDDALIASLDANPDYQRDYVWTLDDKVCLIDSAFQGRDLGKFILVDYEWPRNHTEVVDGKQRISAFADFFSGKFKYKDRYWNDFGRLDRHTVMQRPIQVARLNGSRTSKADILRAFLNINAAGVPQKDEHLAKVRALLAKEENAVESSAKGAKE